MSGSSIALEKNQFKIWMIVGLGLWICVVYVLTFLSVLDYLSIQCPLDIAATRPHSQWNLELLHYIISDCAFYSDLNPRDGGQSLYSMCSTLQANAIWLRVQPSMVQHDGIECMQDRCLLSWDHLSWEMKKVPWHQFFNVRLPWRNVHLIFFLR